MKRGDGRPAQAGTRRQRGVYLVEMGSVIRAAIAIAVAAVIASCGSEPSGLPTSRSTPTSAATTPSPLLAKALRLPQLAPGAPCPAAPVTDMRLPVGSPRGGPTFYLGGPDPKGGFAFNKTVYALVGAHGPVLLRGARLDGAAALKIDGQPADPAERGETVSSQGGEVRTFFSAVISRAAIDEGGYPADVFYLYPATPGCYALQADGAGFEDVVVFVAT